MSRAVVVGAALLGICAVAVAGKTKKVKAKLPDGLAGKLCDQEGIDFLHDEYGYDGPCWDPPGMRIAALMPGAAIKGRREVKTTESETKIWWFEMPEAELDPNNHCARLPGAKPEWSDLYEPYDDGGFATFPVIDYMNQPISEVLDQLDKYDLPLCITVRWDTTCDNGQDKVCSQSAYVGDPIGTDGGLHFIVGSDVADRGTADEERRYPDLIGRKLEDAKAELKARGFTNVKVVEDKVQCERGIVCMTDPYAPASGFVGTNDEITLTVRRAKKK